MSVTIAIDAMGGDAAPHMAIEGLALAAKNHGKHVNFALYGNQGLLEPMLKAHPILKDRTSIIHTEEVITNEMKPIFAMRHAKHSSMGLSIQAVKSGQADGVVSAGNTGAYMAMAKILLKTLDGIDRPAITAILPSANGDVAALDLGANVECSIENLIQFALMGEVFARYVMGKKKPSVGLLNIGTEELKGHSTIRESCRILREMPQLSHFYGFVEGDDITKGTTDVVVTDGFTGNVMLKAIEGVVNLMKDSLKQACMSTLLSRVGSACIAGQLKKVREEFDPRRYNGAIFIGLNGIAVKSHGGTDAYGFSCAIGVAIRMAQNKVNEHIKEGLARIQEGSLSSVV